MAKRKPARNKAVVKQTSGPTESRGTSPTTSAGLASIAAVWLVIAAVDLGFSAFVSDTALRRTQLPFAARITLAAYGLAVLLAAVGAVGALVALIKRVAPPGTPPPVRWTASAATGVLAWVAVFLYGSSWALFWNTGVFLDRQAFAFIAPNPVQVFHWVYPPVAIVVIGGTLAAAVLLALWLPPVDGHRGV